MTPRRVGLVALAACAALGSRCGVPVEPPAGGPTGVDDALARLAARARGLSSVRGFATIEAWHDGQRIKLQQIVLAERPAKLRVETLSPFDQPLSYLATDGERLSMYVLGEQRYLTGAASAQNVARIFPLRLAPAQVVEALLGGLVVPAGDRQLRWDGDRGEYQITVRDAAGRTGAEAWLRADDLAPTEVHGEAPSGDAWTLEVQGWDDAAGRALPRRVRFRMESGGTDVRFRWDERELNPAIPAAAWRIEPPQGVAVESLDLP